MDRNSLWGGADLYTEAWLVDAAIAHWLQLNLQVVKISEIYFHITLRYHCLSIAAQSCCPNAAKPTSFGNLKGVTSSNVSKLSLSFEGNDPERSRLVIGFTTTQDWEC